MKKCLMRVFLQYIEDEFSTLRYLRLTCENNGISRPINLLLLIGLLELIG